MTDFQLSRRAEAELDEIFEYTVDQFGLRQARLYLESLRSCFSLLATMPRMGRLARTLGPKVRRHEHGSHVALYREADAGILILAVVHGRSKKRFRL